MESLEEIRAYFGGDRFATEQTGIEIVEARAGYAKCMLKIDERHKNALGQVMGGVFFVMADFSFAIASNLQASPTVTQTSQITYLSAVKGDVLFAEAEKIRHGRSICFYKITITDNLGTEVAYITTSGFVLQK